MFFYLKCINNYFSHYPLFTLPIFIEEYLTSTTAVGKSTVMEMRSVFRSFHTGDFFPLMEGLSICHFLFPFLLSIAVAANCSSSFIHWKKPKHTLSELGYTKIPTHAPCFLTRATPDWNSPVSLHQTPNCALRWAWLYLISVSRPHAPPWPPPLTASWNALQPKPLPAPRAGDGPIGEQAYVSYIGLRPCNQVLSLGRRNWSPDKVQLSYGITLAFNRKSAVLTYGIFHVPFGIFSDPYFLNFDINILVIVPSRGQPTSTSQPRANELFLSFTNIFAFSQEAYWSCICLKK